MNKILLVFIGLLVSCQVNSQTNKIEVYTEVDSTSKKIFPHDDFGQYSWDTLSDYERFNSVKRIKFYNQGDFQSDSLSSDLLLSKSHQITLRSKWGMDVHQDTIFVRNQYFSVNSLLGFSDIDSILSANIEANANTYCVRIKDKSFIVIVSESECCPLSRFPIFNSFLLDITDTSHVTAHGFHLSFLKKNWLGDFNNDGIIDIAIFENKDVINQNEEGNVEKITVYNYINNKFVKNENYYLITQYDTTENKTYVNTEKSKWFFPLK